MHLRVTGDQIEYPFPLGRIRNENPNTSFPAEMPDELLAAYGVYPVEETERPGTDIFHTVMEDTPALIDGQWRQQWRVTAARVPDKVSAAQIRLFLDQQGLLDSVEASISTMSKSVQIEWEYRTEYTRNSPLLNEVAQTLNLTDGQIDQFFIAAAHL